MSIFLVGVIDIAPIVGSCLVARHGGAFWPLGAFGVWAVAMLLGVFVMTRDWE
jgi:hypothetical protein